MEIWDLYDRERNIIGEHVRGNEIPLDGYHLVIHVWIRNKNGEYLMTQRAANKKTFPLYWECVGGSVIQGENSIEGALREVAEEVGIRFKKEEGKLLFTKIRDTIEEKRYNDIVDVWLFEYNGVISLENATTDEVGQFRWMNRDEIVLLRDTGKLVYSIKDLEYFFNEMDESTK